MAAFTSKATGNWSSEGQTTWNEVGVPADGDTATVSHNITVDAATTVGASGAAGTVAITVTTGITLTVAAGVRLIVRGDAVLQNANLVLAAGASYRFDSSGAAGTPVYKIALGSATSQTANQITANGTSGSHCAFDIAVGSGVGVILRYANAVTAFCGLHATYTDFTSLGNSTSSYGNDAIDINPKGGTQDLYLDHCTFTSCGRVYLADVAAGNNLQITANQWVSTANTSYGFWSACSTVATTGTRLVQENIHALPVSGWAMVFQFSTAHFSIDRNIFSRILWSGVTSTTAIASFEDNLMYVRAGTSSTYSYVGAGNDTISGNYVMIDTAAESSAMWPFDGSGVAGTTTYEDIITETSAANEDMDVWHAGTPTAATTYVLKRLIVLPNSRGLMSGNITHHADKYVTVEIEHCTLMSAEGAGSSTGQAAVYTGSSYAGHANMINKLRSNLVWAKSVPATHGHIAWHSDSYWPDTGTADADSDETHIEDDGSNWNTTANQTLAESGAKVVITAKGAGGPAVGENKIITANDADSLTLASALSAAPDTSTQYKISVVDVINPAQTNYNAAYNLNNGNVYDSVGANAVAKLGYYNFWLSNQAIGANDINLGTGSDENTEGPKFVDSTRNFATADIGCFENATGDTWADATEYAIGDIVSAQTAGFYNNAVINYICVTAHTSDDGHATNGQPGAVASYRTNWEFATASRIRSDVSKIATLQEWVSEGFRIKNESLRDAGHDGVTIGAGDFSVTATQTFTTPYSAPATIHYVGTGKEYTNLQTALDAAADSGAAWTLVLTAGETFDGEFKLKPKSGANWTYVISSELDQMASGTRVSPGYSAYMPKIRLGGVELAWCAAVQTYNSASYYRFCGIEFTTADNRTAAIIDTGGYSADAYADTTPGELYNTKPTSASDLPSYIWFDRCYIHANMTTVDATHWCNTAIDLNGNYMAVFDCYIENIARSEEAYAVHIIKGGGYYHIVNNYLEAGGMSVMVGGSDPLIANAIPSDIEIRGNHCTKRLAWMDGSVSIKNGLECKNGRRLLIEGNWIDNILYNAGGQKCVAISLKSVNQYGLAPWSCTQDVIIRKNRIRGCSKAMNIIGQGTFQSGGYYLSASASHTTDFQVSLPGGSAEYFCTQNVGQTIRITAGTGWTVGDYVIASYVNSRTVALASACATDGATNGSWRMYDYTGKTQNILVENNCWEAMESWAYGVTFTSGQANIASSSHDLDNGDIARFYIVTGPTNITAEVAYYVVNTAASTFQVSLTVGGDAIVPNASGLGSFYSTTSNGFNFSTAEAPVENVIIRHNLLLFNNQAKQNHYSHEGMFVMSAAPTAPFGNGYVIDGLTFTDNIFTGGAITPDGAGGNYKASLDADVVAGYSWSKNVHINKSDDQYYTDNKAMFNAAPAYTSKGTTYSADNWGPDGYAAVKFTAAPSSLNVATFAEFDAFDYRLTASSPYKGQGTDGDDPGPDWDELDTATANTKSGGETETTNEKNYSPFGLFGRRYGTVGYGRGKIIL